ncbi:restriction endonuclease subunit S [Pseudotenacibaculum sp. MALMAid0570]|uniref:restriction endonuclease subunit S n=1 Tax=Pseudotenacibaculum sp. MALMAid0570 TaxID=3143938 RepID=UPI0032DEAC9D
MIEDWVKCRFEDLLDYEQPTNYIVNSTEYDDSYKTPVLTAGKSFIKGYTNEKDGIFDNLPTIIFDDFTTASQFVNFKFKVKSSAMKILVPTSDLINMKFVYYVMQVNKVRSDTHKRYWISIYSKKEIFIPSVNEQRAIVSKIEELFSDLDKGVADLKKAQDQLKVYRQSVLKKAFEGELTQTTLNRIPITEIGEILTGNTPTKKDPNNYNSADYNFYKPTDLDAGNNVIRSNDFLSKQGFNNSRQVPAFSILVTCIGATIGKTGLIKFEGGFNQQINAIVPFENYIPEFIYYQAIGIDFQTQIKINASSTTLPILNKGKFSKLRMNVGSKDEQQRIVQEIESRLSVCDKVEESITESLEKAEALRQSILKKAFEGNLLSTQEIEKCKAAPDYEPAAVLLQKIKNL